MNDELMIYFLGIIKSVIVFISYQLLNSARLCFNDSDIYANIYCEIIVSYVVLICLYIQI